MTELLESKIRAPDFVIMDKNDYQNKLEQLTNHLHYNIMTEDPSKKFHQEMTH